MCQIKTVKNEEYKVSPNFLFLAWSKLFSVLFWLFIISILNELKKKLLQQVQVSPQDFLSASLFLSPLLLLPLSLSLAETFEKNRLTAWGLSAYITPDFTVIHAK